MASNGTWYVSSGSITTGGTIQRVLSQGTGPGADLPELSQIIIKARHGNTSPLYIGTSSTTTSSTNGFEMQPSDVTYPLDVMETGELYIIGATTGDKYDIIAVGP